MDRRALQYFLAVADHGTFTNAAAALHVAQPSLSQAVQGLERELGVKLFYRVKRGARLTAAGEALVGPARRTLRDFDEARDAVLNVSGLRSGRVDIVTQPHLAADPLPQLLAPFHERYPEVTIRITDPGSSDIPGTLHAGEAEIGLDMSPPIDPGLSVMRLPDEEVLILLPPGSPDLGPVVPVSALGNINLVAGAAVEHAPVVRIVREAGMTSRILVETTHRIATVPLVLAGLGAALLTAPVARLAERSGAIACHLNPPMYRSAFLMHLPPLHSAAAGAFLDLVGELVPPIPPLPPGARLIPGPKQPPSVRSAV